MPAYFSISFQSLYSNLYSTYVEDLMDCFISSGYPFLKGHWKSENNSLKEIVDWNQKLLEQKFTVGFTQDVKYDYKQLLFYSDNFSELRVFFMMIGKDIISLDLIIPEYDVLSYKKTRRKNRVEIKFDDAKIEELIILSKKIWSSKIIEAIQTSVESDGCCHSLHNFSNGYISINPFCIIKKDKYTYIKGKKPFTSKQLDNDGVLFRYEDWLV